MVVYAYYAALLYFIKCSTLLLQVCASPDEKVKDLCNHFDEKVAGLGKKKDPDTETSLGLLKNDEVETLYHVLCASPNNVL